MTTDLRKYTPNYTIADYQRWEGEWELWQGIPVAMTPSPFYSQQRVLTKILVQLDNALQPFSNVETVCECDWHVDPHTVVRPDIAVVMGPITTRFIEEPPLAIVEILSSATEQRDRTAKYELYQDQGVKYYLLVDPAQRTCEAFELRTGKYIAMTTQPSLTLELLAECAIDLSPEQAIS